MPTVDELNVRLEATTRDFERDIQRATRRLDDLERQVEQTDRASDQLARSTNRAERSMRDMGRASAVARTGMVAAAAAAAAVTAAVAAMAVQAVRTGIQFNSMLEQVQIGFRTMLGSAQEADRFIREMQRFAATTPFEFPELVTASQRMLAMGFAAEEVLPTLRAVGDAVAALGAGNEGIDRVTRALGQMQAKGKATAEEMLQLTEAGIPAWEILADTIGVSVTEAMDRVAQRTIEADEAIRALVAGIDERFGGMMERQAETVQGLFSTIVDEIRMATASGLEPFFNTLRDELGWVRENLPEITSMIEQMARSLGSIMSFLATETRKFMDDIMWLWSQWLIMRPGTGILDPGELPPGFSPGGTPLPGYDEYGRKIETPSAPTATLQTPADRTVANLIQTDPALRRGMPFSFLHRQDTDTGFEVRQGDAVVVEALAGAIDDFAEAFRRYEDEIRQRIDIARIEGRSGARYEALMWQNVLDYATGRKGSPEISFDFGVTPDTPPGQRNFVRENTRRFREIEQRIERLWAEANLPREVADAVVSATSEGIVTSSAFHRDLSRGLLTSPAFTRDLEITRNANPPFRRGMTFGGVVPTATLQTYDRGPSAFRRGMTAGVPEAAAAGMQATATLGMALDPMRQRFDRLRLEMEAGLVSTDEYRLGLFDLRAQLVRSAAEFGGLAEQSDEAVSFFRDLRHEIARIMPAIEAGVALPTSRAFGRETLAGMMPPETVTNLQLFNQSLQDMLVTAEPMSVLFRELLNAFGGLINQVLEPIRIVAEVMGTLLTPVVRVLAPILAGFGMIVTGVALVMTHLWNTVIDVIRVMTFGLINLNRLKINTEAINDSMDRLRDIMDGTADSTEDAGTAMRDFAQILNAPSGFVVGRYRAGAQDAVMMGSARASTTIYVTIESNDPEKQWREIQRYAERDATRRGGQIVINGPGLAT